MQRHFATYIGVDLGGARGKTTAVARLTRDDQDGGVSVEEVSTRHGGGEPWHDAALIDYIAQYSPEDAVLAFNAPLTVPACLRCQLTVCPGTSQCADPAVAWLLGEGAEIVAEAMENDLDRIAAIPRARGNRASVVRPPQPRPRIEPYIHRGSEVKLCYQRGLLPRDTIGQGTGPIAARAAHLRRILAGMGYDLHRNLLEVSPRATVHALFGARKARGYKRDADPWETRVAIVEELSDLSFAVRSRMSREDVLGNDHCFEALISGYTAYLWARDGWTMPQGVFAEDGWIWAPPETPR